MPSRNTAKIAAARLLAFDILMKVESGGYASDLLMTHSTGLDARDAGLAAEIVFGVLRYQAQLDFLIAHHSGRAPQARPRGAHRPAHGHLSASLPGARSAARRRRRKRRTGEARPQDAPPPASSTPCCARSIAIPSHGPIAHTELSCPEWLLARWEPPSAPKPPWPSPRPRSREPEKYVRISPAGDRMQDIGSQSIVPLLELEPGQTLSRPLRRARQQDRAGARSRRARRRLRPALPPPHRSSSR